MSEPVVKVSAFIPRSLRRALEDEAGDREITVAELVREILVNEAARHLTPEIITTDHYISDIEPDPFTVDRQTELIREQQREAAFLDLLDEIPEALD